VPKLYRVAKFGLKNRVAQFKRKVHSTDLSQGIQKA
jgi:hypothetical protein